MTFREQEATTETAISEAFSSAGLDTDAHRLKAVIDSMRNTKDLLAALWIMLVKDRTLARAAMRAVLAWAESGRPLPPPLPVAVGHQTSSRQRSDGHAVQQTAKQLAKTVEQAVVKRRLYTYRLSDGSILGDRRVCDLPGLASRFLIDATLLSGLVRLCRESGPDLILRDAITPDQFDKAAAEAGAR